MVIFEFEAYPEPKSLTAVELQALCARYKTFVAVGKVIGVSEIRIRADVQGILKKWPDGHCTAQEVAVSQQYTGTGTFSKVVAYDGIGNQDKIDCE